MNAATMAGLSLGALAFVAAWGWHRRRERGQGLRSASEEEQLLRDRLLGVSRTLPRQSSLPALDVSFHEIRRDYSIVSPNPWCKAEGRIPRTGVVACTVHYGISPIGDRVIVDQLEVGREHRRRGYATTLLYAVARHAGAGVALPLTAVHEVWDSAPFWNALRAGYYLDLAVTRGMSTSDAVAGPDEWPPIDECSRQRANQSQQR